MESGGRRVEGGGVEGWRVKLLSTATLCLALCLARWDRPTHRGENGVCKKLGKIFQLPDTFKLLKFHSTQEIVT